MKRVIALFLAACVMCSMLVIVASATAITREVPLRSEKVTSTHATIFSGASESTEKLGMIWTGDVFRTSSNKDATWWYGIAGPNTDFYKEYGDRHGYVMSKQFK